MYTRPADSMLVDVIPARHTFSDAALFFIFGSVFGLRLKADDAPRHLPKPNWVFAG
jgi:hypothetical protein